MKDLLAALGLVYLVVGWMPIAMKHHEAARNVSRAMYYAVIVGALMGWAVS